MKGPACFDSSVRWRPTDILGVAISGQRIDDQDGSWCARQRLRLKLQHCFLISDPGPEPWQPIRARVLAHLSFAGPGDVLTRPISISTVRSSWRRLRGHKYFKQRRDASPVRATALWSLPASGAVRPPHHSSPALGTQKTGEALDLLPDDRAAAPVAALEQRIQKATAFRQLMTSPNAPILMTLAGSVIGSPDHG